MEWRTNNENEKQWIFSDEILRQNKSNVRFERNEMNKTKWEKQHFVIFIWYVFRRI